MSKCFIVCSKTGRDALRGQFSSIHFFEYIDFMLSVDFVDDKQVILLNLRTHRHIDFIPVGYFDAIGFNGFESNLSHLLRESEQILFFELLWIMIDWHYKIFNPIDLLNLPQGERPHKLFFTGS